MVWSNVRADIINKLEKVQNRAVCIVFGCDLRTNVLKMHRKLGWLMVGDTLLYSLLIFVRNISISKTPLVLYKKLQYTQTIIAIQRDMQLAFSLPEIKTDYVKVQ